MRGNVAWIGEDFAGREGISSWTTDHPYTFNFEKKKKNKH
jgi:hypothetical protein